MISSLGSHALRALTPQTAVTVDRSRCVRHRCKRNACSFCQDVCPSGAVRWDETGLQVSSSLCTQCLRCLSVCPTAALRSPEFSLLQTLADLAAHPQPVLGCHRFADAEAHARTTCLGHLAHPELLLLLALVFKDGLQVNLTSCKDCPNGHVLDGILATHALLATLQPGHKVRLVQDRQDLKFQPASLSRRELFSFFRERSKRTAAVVVERLQTTARLTSYGSKQVPEVRALLFKMIEALPETQRQQVVEWCCGQIVFTATCTVCGGCVGVCPTGAIEPADEGDISPVFDRNLCVACGSCEAFCRKSGVQCGAETEQHQHAAP